MPANRYVSGPGKPNPTRPACTNTKGPHVGSLVASHTPALIAALVPWVGFSTEHAHLPTLTLVARPSVRLKLWMQWVLMSGAAPTRSSNPSPFHCLAGTLPFQPVFKQPLLTGKFTPLQSHYLPANTPACLDFKYMRRRQGRTIFARALSAAGVWADARARAGTAP